MSSKYFTKKIEPRDDNNYVSDWIEPKPCTVCGSLYPPAKMRSVQSWDSYRLAFVHEDWADYLCPDCVQRYMDRGFRVVTMHHHKSFESCQECQEKDANIKAYLKRLRDDKSLGCKLPGCEEEQDDERR